MRTDDYLFKILVKITEEISNFDFRPNGTEYVHKEFEDFTFNELQALQTAIEFVRITRKTFQKKI